MVVSEKTDIDELLTPTPTSQSFNEYVQDAWEYWTENNMYEPTGLILHFLDVNNSGVVFGRKEKDNFHISRFVVQTPKQGFGEKIIRYIQETHKSITLWSNPGALEFYVKCGFIFTENKVESYTYGKWCKNWN